MIPGHFRLGRLNQAAGVCGGRGQPMGFELGFGPWVGAAYRLRSCRFLLDGAKKVLGMGFSRAWLSVELAVFAVWACVDTLPGRVPKHTDGRPWSVGHELSKKGLTWVDLQRISSAVNLSTRTMTPPQRGHNQEADNLASPA